MFGGHIWELVIVLALALVVFGPKRLPEIGGAMGKGIREFKKGTSELSDLGDATKQQPTSSPASHTVSTAEGSEGVSPAPPTREPEGSPVPPSGRDHTAG